jgi:hypothetical protein
VEPFFLGDLFGGERGAHTGCVDRAVPKPSQVHLVVNRKPRNTFEVAVGVEAVLAQGDSGEPTGGGLRGMNRHAASAKVSHGSHIGVADKPEQRTIGVDAEHFPLDAARQPLQQGAAQTYRRASAQTLRVPANPVVNGDVDTFILVIALLVGHRGDQFLVDTTLHVGKIDGLHGQTPYPNPMTSVAAEPEGRPALDRPCWNGLEEASAGAESAHLSAAPLYR